jgi:hypothetical protein
MPQVAPGQQAKPVVFPRGGPTGSEVVVTMAGLEPFQTVRVGFGSLSQYEVIGRGDADSGGLLLQTLVIPSWGERDRPHYFVASFGNRIPRILSEPFHVTDENGVARIYGTVTADGTSCLSVEGPEKTLYTLEGDVGLWSPGQRVLVIGTIAEGVACGSRGLPIAVREIQPSL